MKKRTAFIKFILFGTILFLTSKINANQKFLICEMQTYTGGASSLRKIKTQTWQLKIDHRKNSIEKYKFLGENSYSVSYPIILSSANKLIAYDITPWNGISSLILDLNTNQLSYVHHFLKPNRESLSLHYGICKS